MDLCKGFIASIMKIKASDKDLKCLLSGGSISQEIALRILHEHHLLTQQEVDYANSLLPNAGNYLPRWWVRKFIRAEISDDEAREAIASTQLLIERMRELFPALVQHLKITDPLRAGMTFNIVFDACADYPTILRSGHKEANRKKIIQRMVKIQKHIVKLGVLLEDGDATRDYGFDNAHRLYMKHVYNKEFEATNFWKLKRDINFLSYYLQFCIYKSHKESDFLVVIGNDAKTHLVDCAYGLTLPKGYPPFVTTPGSDFSSLCSIIYEIASGVANESLAGAINRYARSEERAEADRNEVEYSSEREIARDEDNFYDLKHSSAGSASEIAELEAMLRDVRLSKEARLLVFCELEEAIENAEKREKLHGPFLMWASQMKIDWDERLREHQDFEEKRLQSDIDFGKSRRSRRED